MVSWFGSSWAIFFSRSKTQSLPALTGRLLCIFACDVPAESAESTTARAIDLDLLGQDADGKKLL